MGLAVPLAPAGASTLAPEPTEPLDGGFTVEVEPGAEEAVRAELDALGIAPSHEFEHVLDGFAISVTAAEAAEVQALPGVAVVRAETVVTAQDVRTPVVWGLDRIDQAALPLDWSYTYPPSAGQGVRVYVLDTGVEASHPSFHGQVEPGYSVFSDGPANTDCGGHGTHVAGTVIAEGVGVATKAHVVPVQVLDCWGDGSTSTVLAGVDWVLQNHTPGTPAVVNLSLGGPRDLLIDAAVTELVDAGMFVSVAAGNSDADACSFSPAGAPAVFTVGGSTITDNRQQWSNWGSCVDVFAPGQSISSILPGPSSGAMSGTSQASPHVAGAAALYLAEHPTASPAQVTDAIRAAATHDVVIGAGPGSTRSLLSVRALVQPDPAAPLPPTSLRKADATRSSVTLAWNAPASGPTPTDYRVEMRTMEGWTVIDDGVSTATTATVTGLATATLYSFQVSSVAGDLSSWAATPVNIETARNRAPFGNFERVGVTGKVVTLSGWALDRDVVGPIPVHVYVDGAWGGALSTVGVRDDVAAAYPGTGNQHGFTHTFTATPGNHQVCAYAINDEGGVNTALGCRTAAVTNHLPTGNFESLTVAGSTVTLTGWTLDPDTTAPIDVHYYVDGAWGGSQRADLARPDVARAYPGTGDLHGFTRAFTASPGTHQVCAYAIDATTSNTPLGCRSVTVAAPRLPIGNFESLTASGTQVTLRGWAADLDTSTSVTVHYYVNGRYGGSTATSVARPDVRAVHPAAGADAGFSRTFTAGSGTHQVCAYAIDTSVASRNTALGCRTVTVTG
jgi:subtilisin family serine protease